jgi:hypothetical protein
MGSDPRRFSFVGALLFCAAASLACAQSLAPQSTQSPLALPADLPKDCPIYPGAVVRDYHPLVRNNKQVGHALILEAQATEKTVLDFYKKAMPAQGWRMRKHPKIPAYTLEGEKDGRSLMIGIVAIRLGANPSTTLQLGIEDKH